MTLALAAGYIVSVSIVYYSFVRWYRASKSNTNAKTQAADWFGDGHPARKAYLELYDSMPDEFGPTQIKQLKAALLMRAKANIKRVLSLREDRAVLALLLRNGAIGDDLWQEFTDAEAEINLEVQQCMREAEDLQKGWGQQLFPEASQAVQQEAQDREREAQEAQAKAQAEIQFRQQMQAEIMRRQQLAAAEQQDSDEEEMEADAKPAPVPPAEAKGPVRRNSKAGSASGGGRRNSLGKK